MNRLWSRLRLPGKPERLVLAAGSLVWAGTALGRATGSTGIAATFLLAAISAGFVRRGAVLVLAACLVGGTVSGSLAAAEERAVLTAPAPDGPVRMAGRALDDVRPGRDGDWFLLKPTHLQRGGEWTAWEGPVLLVGAGVSVEVAAGQRVRVDGTARPVPGRARGNAYAGRVAARETTILGPAADPLFRVANSVRERVAAGLASYGGEPAAALVSGFLIGDVRKLPRLEAEHLRAAGLSHYVAVSGSNVAVFLGLWWVIAGPLAMGTRRRALVGIAGLALFAVITRWEPSVLRAAAMAGLVLGGRAVGLALTPWAALGAAVGGVLLVAGELGSDVGFQLSVAATVGVIAGANVVRVERGRWIAAAFGVTLSAQAAVAPLLLLHFGSVPLVAPLANVLAAPLVLGSTVSGGLGVLSGLQPLVAVAVGTARLVLAIARWAAPWPQLEVGGVALLALLAVGSIWKIVRPALLVTLALWLATATFLPAANLPRAALVFFDVGQGDAILLRAESGATVLVDGGPDPVVLLRKLRKYRIDRIDLVVLSHPHIDHLAGVRAAVESIPVGRLWHPGFIDGDGTVHELLDLAGDRGVAVEVPEPGWTAHVGDIQLRVLGPLRRYASPNDQSLVLLAEVHDRTVLLPGDVEVIAQRELGVVEAEILKVPHQGAATSDLDWLGAVRAQTAVVSVGPNSFGHPSEEVLAALAAAGADVLRTDRDGDVVIPLEP